MSNNKTTNKAIVSGLTSAAIDQHTFSAEMMEKIKTEDPKRAEKKSRIARMGEAGSRANTHARMNGYLSGLSAPEMRVLKMIAGETDPVPAITKATREEKYYIQGICAVLASETKRPDFSAMNEAVKKIDPSFAGKQVPHKTALAIIEAIDDCETGFSTHYIKEILGQSGYTQAKNALNFLAKFGIAEQYKNGGNDRTIKLKEDHPLVTKIRELCAKKKLFA